MSLIRSSPLSDYHRLIASNQFAMPAMSYFMWNQHWPITELKEIDREARKIVVENEGRHPCGLTSLLCLQRDKGGRILRSIERECKETKVKAAVKLFQNREPVKKAVRDFEKRVESVGHQSLTKEAAKYAEEYGLHLKLQYPYPDCVTEEGKVIPGEKLKSHLSKEGELRLKGDLIIIMNPYGPHWSIGRNNVPPQPSLPSQLPEPLPMSDPSHLVQSQLSSSEWFWASPFSFCL